MAKFLNTDKLRYWIKELILRSKHELVIVVPYIKTSNEMFQALKQADTSEVETTIIYRENKLTDKEKERISSLNNLNLLHHPNVHCKCYFNGELIVICSMNLYEYSEKNNREMGILLHKNRLENENGWNSDDEILFQDAIHEIREIMNGANLELLPETKKNRKFSINILKTEEEKSREKSNELNMYFFNKIFTPTEINRDTWYPVCKNYFDKIDVSFHSNRIAIDINLPESELEFIYKDWMKTYNEYEFIGFKYYWNYYKSSLYLYRDNNFDWENITDQKIINKKYKQGIDLIISRFREVAKK